MSTPPVTSVTEELIAELEAATDGAKGWQLGHAFQVVEEGYSPDEWDWHVGAIDEDGNQYPVLLVDTGQYDQPEQAEGLARYYAAVNPATILALLAERAELKRAERNRDMWKDQCERQAAKLAELRLEIEGLKRAPADADAAHMMYAGQIVELEQDAARYQWLRDKHNDENGICWVSVWDRDRVEWVSLDKAYVAGFDVFENGLDLDAAIDAAIQEAKP